MNQLDGAASLSFHAKCGRATKPGQSQSQTLAYVDQGYTGERAEKTANDHAITLEVAKLPEAKKGFVLLPRRWVVERTFAWATRSRRLVRDYERYASTLADLHIVAFVCIMLRNLARLATGQ